MSDYCRKCKSRLSNCPRCNGKGTVVKSGWVGLGPVQREESCPNCRGTGKICPEHGYNHG